MGIRAARSTSPTPCFASDGISPRSGGPPVLPICCESNSLMAPPPAFSYWNQLDPLLTNSKGGNRCESVVSWVKWRGADETSNARQDNKLTALAVVAEFFFRPENGMWRTNHDFSRNRPLLCVLLCVQDNKRALSGPRLTTPMPRTTRECYKLLQDNDLRPTLQAGGQGLSCGRNCGLAPLVGLRPPPALRAGRVDPGPLHSVTHGLTATPAVGPFSRAILVTTRCGSHPILGATPKEVACGGESRSGAR